MPVSGSPKAKKGRSSRAKTKSTARTRTTSTTGSRATKSANKIKTKTKNNNSSTTSSNISTTQPQVQLRPPTLVGRPLPTLILDTGGWSIKHATFTPNSNTGTGTSSNNNVNININASASPRYSYNVIAKPKHQLTTTLLSNEIDTINNKSQLIFKRPLERGYTTDLATQFQIWDYILLNERFEYRHSFSNGGAKRVLPLQGTSTNTGTASSSATVSAMTTNANSRNVSPMNSIYTHTAAVLCLHQPFTPRSIFEKEDEVWFRDFGYGRVGRILGVCCSAFHYLNRGKQKKQQQQQQQQETCKLEDYDDDETGCCLVIDSGFSLTHIVPTIDSHAIAKAIRRINIGGKLFTNLLKEQISYRQWNMMDEYYIVNEAKEKLCYVSSEFDKDMEKARNETRTGCREFDREFVLPDYVKTSKGSVRIPYGLQMLMDSQKDHNGDIYDSSDKNNDGTIKDTIDKAKNEEEKQASDNDDSDDSEDETEDQARRRIMKQKEEERRRREMEDQEKQALLLSLERFTIPEILFRPLDIGMKQLGIAEAIVQSIEACEPMYRAAMYNNIVLTGGNVKLPNFKQRLEMELRTIAPINYNIRIYVPEDPISYAFEGARDILISDEFIGKGCIDRAEWEVIKQSGNIGDIWHSNNNKELPDGFVLI